MMSRIKEYRLRKRLESMFQKATARRDSNKGNEWVSYYDYLNDSEQAEYSRLATEHFHVCQKLKKGYSPYFVKHRDPVRNDPNSPKALVTVDHDVSTKVSHEYGDDGLIYARVDGKRSQFGRSPEEFFGTRLTHAERWEEGWEPEV